MGTMNESKSPRKKPEREYVTAISIEAGIITLIEPDGELAQYRQRGIDKLSKQRVAELMGQGLLAPYWWQYKALPSNYSISFEDEEIMGRARASFPYK